MNYDRPFNQQIEIHNPWFSDPSHRMPFDLTEDESEARRQALQSPPITRYLKRHPWDLQKFMSRQVPEKYRSALSDSNP